MFAAMNVERTLTELDFARLMRKDGQLPAELESCFAFPHLVASRDIAADVITMNSRVEIVDPLSHRRQ